jgi:CrcB protein
MSLLVWTGLGLAGALGSLSRFYVGTAVTEYRASDFPYGTFVVNVSGAFVLGLLTGLAPGMNALAIAGTGFLGGYTTFSTWMVETERLGEDGEWLFVSLYLFGSMAAGLASGIVGWLLGGALR